MTHLTVYETTMVLNILFNYCIVFHGVAATQFFCLFSSISLLMGNHTLSSFFPILSKASVNSICLCLLFYISVG